MDDFRTSSRRELSRLNSDFIRPAAFSLGGTLGAMWLVELLDFLTGRLVNLDRWGIRPRDFDHLLGIFVAPFLHIDFSHLMTNSIPFIILGGLIFWRDRQNFWLVSLIVLLVSGIGTWLFGGPNTVHIGASGVVFGYLGYLLALGFFERSPMAISRSLLVGFVYGGVLWGVLPFQAGISWQGHLFGFIGGVWAAFLFARRRTLADHIKIDGR